MPANHSRARVSFSLALTSESLHPHPQWRATHAEPKVSAKQNDAVLAPRCARSCRGSTVIAHLPIHCSHLLTAHTDSFSTKIAMVGALSATRYGFGKGKWRATRGEAGRSGRHSDCSGGGLTLLSLSSRSPPSLPPVSEMSQGEQGKESKTTA